MSSTSPTAAMPNPADTLTLADLKNWNRRDQAGNFLPSLAVLGHPVAHSVSPQMHNAALAELAKKYPQLKDWCYFKFDIEPLELHKAFVFLPANNFQGVNLTVPHKGDASAIINANLPTINTVKFTTAGPRGFNTDGFGMVQSLTRDLKVELAGKAVVILGAGGAATGVAEECLRRNCAALWIGNRDATRQTLLIKNLREYLNNGGITNGLQIPKIYGFSPADSPVNDWPDEAIIINATTLGMKRDNVWPLEEKFLDRLRKSTFIFDMVYNREGPTQFVAAASKRGLRAADGLGMLVWQGAKSLCIWLQGVPGVNVEPDDIAPIMKIAAREALNTSARHA